MLASWLTDNFDLEATALRDLRLRDGRDIEIFQAAQVANAVIMTAIPQSMLGHITE